MPRVLYGDIRIGGVSDGRAEPWHRALRTGVRAWVVVPRTIQTLTAPKYRGQIGMESPPYTFWASTTLTVLGLGVLAFALLLGPVHGLARNPLGD